MNNLSSISKPKMVGLGLVAAYLVFAVIYHFATNANADSGHGGSGFATSLSVLENCKAAVRDRLDDDDADFSVTGTTTDHFSAVWEVEGPVDSDGRSYRFHCATDDEGRVTFVDVR